MYLSILYAFVVNENSVSTPVRIVFDASSATASGFSINDILAKGINCLNSMPDIWIRFRLVVVAVHTDIKMMYNVVKVSPAHWTYQRYFWDNELNPDHKPQKRYNHFDIWSEDLWESSPMWVAYHSQS